MDRNGFGLTEVLVSVGIFSIVTAALFMQMNGFTKFEAVSFGLNTAKDVALGEIELLENAQFKDLKYIAENGGGFSYRVKNQVIYPGAFTTYDITNKSAIHNKMEFPNNFEGSVFVELNEVPGSHNNLLSVRVAVCYRAGSGIVVGEDQNLNGKIDGGEDANGNGKLDSPVVFETAINNKQ